MSANERKEISIGQLAREVAASLCYVRTQKTMKRELDLFVRGNSVGGVMFIPPWPEEVDAIEKALLSAYESAINVAIERVRLQRLNITPGDDMATTLDAIIATLQAVQKDFAPEPPA